MERTRRIWETCYMNFGVGGRFGRESEFVGIIDTSDFPTLQTKELMPSQVKTSLSERDSIVVESNGRPPLRIALFGFGTVGSSVARILLESKPEGVVLTHIFNRNVARKKVDWVPDGVVWSEDWEQVLAGAATDVRRDRGAGGRARSGGDLGAARD